MLRRLRDHGNSVLVVEHDPAVIRAADWIVDVGPRAGDGGGEVVFSGGLDDLMRSGRGGEVVFVDQRPVGREGRRYRDDVLKLTYHGRSIHDVLEMTVADALGFFASVEEPRKRSAGIGRGLQLLVDVGVGYLRLGQSLSTLSGGEAQRLKLASELTPTGNVYVMDEPTTGLHPADIDRLLTIVDRERPAATC